MTKLPDTALRRATDWLAAYMIESGGRAPSALIKQAAAEAGHSPVTLNRARAALGVSHVSYGLPRRTDWVLDSTTVDWLAGCVATDGIGAGDLMAAASEEGHDPEAVCRALVALDLTISRAPH